jgi:hypothetical protein
MPVQMAPPSMGGGDTQSTCVLKLKGLPFSATEKDLHEFFGGFAVVKAAVHMGHDGRPSGLVRPPCRLTAAHLRSGQGAAAQPARWQRAARCSAQPNSAHGRGVRHAASGMHPPAAAAAVAPLGARAGVLA